MNALCRLGMHERHANASQKAKRYKTLFEIVKSIILKCKCRASKDLLGICEVQAVMSRVCSSLGFVLRKLHLRGVYTYSIFVKEAAGAGQTSDTLGLCGFERVTDSTRQPFSMGARPNAVTQIDTPARR